MAKGIIFYTFVLLYLFRQKGQGTAYAFKNTFVMPRCLAIREPKVKRELSIR